MNGATAVPLLIRIKPPNKSNVRIMGSSQYFFLSLMNPHKSLIKSIYSSKSIWFFYICLLVTMISNMKDRSSVFFPFFEL